VEVRGQIQTPIILFGRKLCCPLNRRLGGPRRLSARFVCEKNHLFAVNLTPNHLTCTVVATPCLLQESIKIGVTEIYCEGVSQIGIGTINGLAWKEHWTTGFLNGRAVCWATKISFIFYNGLCSMQPTLKGPNQWITSPSRCIRTI